MPPYNERFRTGSRVRVKLRPFLEKFQSEWKYHHPVTNQQLDSAGVVDTVKDVSFYHGGDTLYTLANIPGTWHEDCLEQVDE